MSEPSVIEVTPYENEGFFFELTFDGDEHPTVFFVAERDLEGLVKMARNPDRPLEDLRNELLALLEHSGHPESKTLADEKMGEIRDFLLESELVEPD